MMAGRTQRQKDISLLTIHGTFTLQTKNERLIVSELQAIGKTKLRRFTYPLYLMDGVYGSGSGHDPVYVYV